MPGEADQTTGAAVFHRYAGRFAPSPTGPLHFGSLVAAAASFLDARSHGASWHVRIEDLDGPRCSREWADDILRALDTFGFIWDGPVVYQSAPERQAAYSRAFATLQAQGLLYPCGCSRKEIAGLGADHGNGTDSPYNGLCREGLGPGREAR